MPQNAEKKLAHLEEEFKRKDQIIAVVTEEALKLKKTYQIERYKHVNLQAKLDLLDMLERYVHYRWIKKAICRKWNINLEAFRSLKKSLKKPIGHEGFN